MIGGDQINPDCRAHLRLDEVEARWNAAADRYSTVMRQAALIGTSACGMSAETARSAMRDSSIDRDRAETDMLLARQKGRSCPGPIEGLCSLELLGGL